MTNAPVVPWQAVVYFALALAIEYGGTLPWLSALFARPGQYVDHLRGRFRRWRSNGREPEGPGEEGLDEEEGGEEDDDVAREEQRVMSGGARSDVVRLERLRKVYSLGGGRRKVAVKKLSFGVARGETLGFLGINGAGAFALRCVGEVSCFDRSLTGDGKKCVRFSTTPRLMHVCRSIFK